MSCPSRDVGTRGAGGRGGILEACRQRPSRTSPPTGRARRTPSGSRASSSGSAHQVTAVDGVDLAVAARRDRRVPRPERRRQDHDDRHDARLQPPGRRHRRDPRRDPAQAIAQGRIAAVLQTGGLLKDLTVAETVRLTASLFPTARPVDEVLDRAGIADIADRRVGSCSGGQQQRLRFALALLPDPDLLLLDEPTTGMDVEGRRDFWAAIRADAGRGRTVLFATHYLEEADEYADRIVLIRRGRIVADGTPAARQEPRRRPHRPRHPAGRRPDRAARRPRRDVRRGARRHRPAARPTTPTRPPASCSPRRPRATSRSPRTAWRTPSSP